MRGKGYSPRPSVTDVNAILETPRLMLREFTPADADALFRVIGDRETMRWYLRPFTPSEVGEWITRNRARYEKDGHGLWALLIKPRLECIGDCGLVAQEVEGERLVEIAYHVRRDCWGRGYATEAARAALRFGFETLGLNKLISLIRPENTQSRRVAEKNGLHIERQTMRVGLVHDVWTIERDEWLGATQNAKFGIET